MRLKLRPIQILNSISYIGNITMEQGCYYWYKRSLERKHLLNMLANLSRYGDGELSIEITHEQRMRIIDKYYILDNPMEKGDFCLLRPDPILVRALIKEAKKDKRIQVEEYSNLGQMYRVSADS